ncbi:MAG: hypothetical protein RIF33_11685 [Cyclobacteriaceae bacterium]
MTEFNTTSDKEAPQRPTHLAYRVEGKGRSANWIKLGACWSHKDDKGFDLILNTIDKDIRLVIRRNDPATDQS